MTTRTFLRQYWRIPLIAFLGALIAFAGSFVLQETYASSTRLLIRGRSTTFLTSSGQDLSQQPGVIDSSLAKTLSETQAGVATSREVATMVVDRLHLDAPKPEKSGPVAWSVGAFATTYKCGRAYLTYGVCKDPDPREKAIQDVQAGIVAGQLGAATGADAGQPGSYVMELVGSGDTADQARDITNVAADSLVQVSSNRFREDAQKYADNLGAQVQLADQEVDTAAKAVGDFKVTHNISDLDQQLVLNASNSQDASGELRRAQSDLAGAQAQLASLDASIASVSPTQQTEQNVQNGRSNSKLTTEGPSSVYTDLVAEREKVAGQVANLQAKQASLQSQTPAGSTTLNQDQVQFLQLDQQLKLAQANQAKLTQDHRNAVVNAQSDSVELTRIDTASLSTYPVAPKRYLYLALGLLIGGLAGGALTWSARRRGAGTARDDELDDDADDDDFFVLEDEALDLRDRADPRVLVPAGAGPSAGSLFARPTGTGGNGNGNGDAAGMHGAAESP